MSDQIILAIVGTALTIVGTIMSGLFLKMLSDNGKIKTDIAVIKQQISDALGLSKDVKDNVRNIFEVATELKLMKETNAKEKQAFFDKVRDLQEELIELKSEH